MKLNNKGFAISGILYSLLILFLSIFIGLLGILASTKFSYDKVKNDIFNKIGNLPYKDEILNGADPVLKEGMIPVIITNDGKVYKANLKNKWYDYDIKMWANAVTVTDTNRKKYQDMKAGEEIKEEDILTYFVWIPRYKYKLWHVETAIEELNPDKVHSIDIVFENNKSVKSLGAKNGEYLTHPAFTFGEEELNGIWVGKFETGYNEAQSTETAQVEEIDASKVIIKPSTVNTNVYSWRLNSVSNMYFTARQMNQNENIFGITSDSDTHMMKNTEWGAVAYLSHSQYGTCTNGVCHEVYINNNNAYMTGCGGDFAGDNQINICENQYGTKLDGIYNQSTTGNISGIFDMSGGAWEYVMGYTTSAETPYGDSGFDNTTFPNDSKYIDIYSSTFFGEYNNRILGDATGEMGPFDALKGSWYNDMAFFIDSTLPWFQRGGNNNIIEVAGLASFVYESGTGIGDCSFRIIIS